MNIVEIIPNGVWPLDLATINNNDNKHATPNKYRVIYRSIEFYFNISIYDPFDIEEFFKTIDILMEIIEFNDNEYCNDNFCKCTNVGFSYNPKTLTFYNNKNGLELYNNVIRGLEISEYRIEIVLKYFGKVYQQIDIGYDGMISKSFSLIYRCYTFNITSETVNVDEVTFQIMKDFIECIDYLIDNTNFDKIYDTHSLKFTNGIYSCTGLIIKPYMKNLYTCQ